MKWLLTYTETATALSVSRRTLCRLVETGELPSIMIGKRRRRFHVRDLEAFIEARRIPKAGNSTPS